MKYLFPVLLLTTLFSLRCFGQNIGFNTDGSAPNIKAMVDIASTNSGLLIPRMTSAQRDSITTPPNGLQVYNITTNTLDIYRNSRWEAVTFTNAASNLVYVSSLNDLPGPTGNSITLNANKMYVFSGIVNISPYYLELNGAGLRGMDPGKDGVMSSVSGAVLRSKDVSVFMENLAVIPLSANTKGYDFSDGTGTKFCNIFSGCSVVEAGIASLGVGLLSGFKAITFIANYWNCKDGIKITGNVGKFAATFNFITSISEGAGIEFLSGLVIDDIDLSNNYFIYTGQTGVKVVAGAIINRGRMTTNMYRGVGTYISGFDSFTPEWEMRQNSFIPNSSANVSIYMNNNNVATSLIAANTFYKIAGATTMVKEQRFTTLDNKVVYIGREKITSKVLLIVGAKSPASGGDFSIAIAKNGVIIPTPNGSMAPSTNNQSFQITFATEVDITTGDYLEAFIRTNNSNSTSITIEEMQFRVTD